MGRLLVLVLLGLAMAGFGVCSLCGGVVGLGMLSDNSRSARDIAWLAFGCSGVGLLITGVCWWGFRALKRKRPAG